MKLGPHSVTIVRAARRQADYGNATELDWDAATRKQSDGWSVQPAPSDEFTIDRDTFTTRWLAYGPPDVDVSAFDRIEWQGDSYDIDGDVLRWDFGSLAHVVINLRRSENA